MALKIQNCGIAPEWFVGPYSFLEFSAATVRKKYPDKDDDGLKPLYISAVTSWDDLREAYPAWRNKQEKKAKAEAHNKTVEKAKNNPPKNCQCNGQLITNGTLYRCIKCGQTYEFNENLLKWVFSE
jgi:hypothetical protein